MPKQRARKGRGGRWYTPAETRGFEASIRALAIATFAQLRLPARRGWPVRGRFYVEVGCYFPDARRRDADNVAKAVLDACNQVLWVDDSQVAIKAHPYIDRVSPRTDVRVEVLQEYAQLYEHAQDERARRVIGNAEEALRELARAAQRADEAGWRAQERALLYTRDDLTTRLVAALQEDCRQ